MNGLSYVEYSDILNINSSALLLLGGGEIEFIYLEFNKLDVLYDANTCLTHLVFHCKGWLTCSLCNEVPCLQANYKIQFHH